MRILMVGALSVPYIHDNWVMPIKELYDVDFVDVSPLFALNKPGYHEQYIYAVIRTGDYDYLFFYNDIIKSEFSAEFFTSIRQAGVPIVTFYPDDEPEIWYRQNLPTDPNFDLVGTHSSRGLERRQQSGTAQKFMYLPWGFNPSIFQKVSACEKIYDVVCFGAIKANSRLYLQESDFRIRLLEKTFEICQKAGVGFRLFGDGWEQHPVLSACAGGFVANEDMVRIYNQAKIVFNPGFSADKTNITYQTKLRHFEVPGCGAFQLTNYNPELADLFEEDQSIVFFRDEEELGQKITYYLENDEARERIASNGYIQAQQCHTMQKRLTEMFDRMQSMYPVKSKNKVCKAKPKIQTIYVTGLAEARRVLTDFSKGRQLDGEYDFIHIICANTKIQNIEYSTLHLPDFSKNMMGVGVRSHLQLASVCDDPMQRIRKNMVGTILPEWIEKRDQTDKVLEYIRQNFIMVENEKYMAILSNYLVLPQCLPEIAKVFLDGDFSAFSQFEFYRTGRLLNDYIVHKGNWSDQELAFYVPYKVKLKKLFDNIDGSSERVLLYGGAGAMAGDVFALLKEYSKLCVLGVVDRGLAAAHVPEINGLPVYSYEDIEQLKPTIILIAAEHSGPMIYESLKKLRCLAAIVPLYNMDDSVWNVLIA